MKIFKLAICLAFSFFALQADNRLENLAKESACQGYDEEFIDLIEMVYGKGFLSQGNQKCVDNMVKEVHLEGRNILDIGSGLGAPALYLAERYGANVIGTDPQRWMVERAQLNLEEVREKLKGSAKFVLLENPSHLRQFSDNQFDVIFSKEAILHVPLEIKEAFFKEVFRVLKPGGEIVILDWLRSSFDYSANTKKMMEMDGVAFHLITPVKYLNILENAGFTQIEMENTSSEHAAFSQENIATIEKLSTEITAKFGRDVYEYCIESWGFQRDAFRAEEIITAIFRATKKND